MAPKRGRESDDDDGETHRTLPPATRNLNSTDAGLPAPAPSATSSSQPHAPAQQTLSRTQSAPGNNYATPSNPAQPANPQSGPQFQQQFNPIFLPSDTDFMNAINTALSALPKPADASAAPNSGTAFYPLAFLDLTGNTTSEQRTIIHSQEATIPSFKLHLDRARTNLSNADPAGIAARRQQVMHHRILYEQQMHAAVRAQWRAADAERQRQEDEARRARRAERRRRDEEARRAQAAAEQRRLLEEAQLAEQARIAAARRDEEIARYAAWVARQNYEAWFRNNRQ